MLTIKDICNNVMLSELEECISECRTGAVLVTVKQVTMNTSGEAKLVDIVKYVFSDTTNLIRIDNEYIHVEINLSDPLEYSKIKSAWDMVLDRGTERALENKNNDLSLFLDIVKQEPDTGYSYIMSFSIPKFVAQENIIIRMSFLLESLHFSMDPVDYIAVNNEVEYAEEEAMRTLEREAAQQDRDFDENEEIIGNDDVLNS